MYQFSILTFRIPFSLSSPAENLQQKKKEEEKTSRGGGHGMTLEGGNLISRVWSSWASQIDTVATTTTASVLKTHTATLKKGNEIFERS